ncbi:MAG: hypothetical protein HRU09_18035 [Oligoflexales bacterium]|nr:hypothetical protein [Oligoflexales bacterium]
MELPYQVLACNVRNDAGVLDISDMKQTWTLSFRDGTAVDFWYETIENDDYHIAYIVPEEYIGEIKVSLETEDTVTIKIVWTAPESTDEVISSKGTEEDEESTENGKGALEEDEDAEEVSPASTPVAQDQEIQEDPEPAMEAFSYEKADIMALCESADQVLETQRITFPASSGCDFGEGGNLEARDSHLQAQKSQIATLSLKPDHVICGLTVRSNKYMIDDFGSFNLDGKAILVNNNALICGEGEQESQDSCLSTDENQLITWDFNQVKGMEIDFSAPSYCYGQDDSETECELPGHDEYGRIFYRLGLNTATNLASQFKDKTDLDFELVTTGDNDSSDCQNSRLRVRFRVMYAPIPSITEAQSL